MIPIAQLDPASLAMWLNFDHVSAHPASDELVAAMVNAAFGDVQGALEVASSLRERSPERTRCIHLTSVVWHEQRHFLDLLLTNYGAFRVRQFLTLYWNAGGVLARARDAGRAIHCPITGYADPVRVRLAALDTSDGDLIDLAQDSRTRLEMIGEEQRVVDTPWGRLQLGGDAQLEALGYLFQFGAINQYFGCAAERDVQLDLPPGLRGNLRYEWAQRLGLALGFVPGRGIGDVGGGTGEVVAFDATLLVPVLIGSLATRRWGQSQVVDERGGSGFAASRLFGFLRTFADRTFAYGGLSTDEAWTLVNDVAKSLWGRTVMEEMWADFELEEHRFGEVVEKREIDDDVVASVLSDYHETRRGLLEVLARQPRAILDPEVYAHSLLPLIRPLPVIASPGGTVGSPPEGWERVLGFHAPPPADATWWWAAVPTEWPNADECVGFRSRRTWIEVVSEFAPLAKLMLNGYRHDTMLGPEVHSIQMRLDGNVEFRVDPFYSRPPERSNAAGHLAFLTGQEEGSCDWCGNRVPIADAWLLSPWKFRRSAEIARRAVEKLGGGNVGMLLFHKGWSPWLVCAPCNEELAALQRRRSLDPVR